MSSWGNASWKISTGIGSSSQWSDLFGFQCFVYKGWNCAVLGNTILNVQHSYLLFKKRILLYLKGNCKSQKGSLYFSSSIVLSIIHSVQFSCSVVSDSLWPYGLQHARPPCPSPTSGVYANSCPLSRWCHPSISSSVVPFSSHPQSFPASGSFQMSQLLASGGQSIGVSASTSALPVNIQDWFPLGWTGWISSKGLLKSLLQHHSSKASILQCSAFFIVQLSYPYMTTGKTTALTRRTFVGKVAF